MRVISFLTYILFVSSVFPQNYNGLSLLDQPDGFAAMAGGTTGGAGGQVVTATTGAQLLTYMDSRDPLIVQISGTLTISGMKNSRSNKTYIGLGSNAKITGGGIYVYNMSNIIIRNISFENSTEDAIGLTTNTHHVWVDHCTFQSCPDGLIDIKQQANYITVSNCLFYNHGKTMLIGHNDSYTQDIGYLKVTVHHNWFKGTQERHPRVRFGEVHVYNNYFQNTSVYGAASTCDAKVVVEGNYFENVPFPTHSGYMTSGPGDLVQRRNVFVNSGTPEVRGTAFEPSSYYQYTLDSASSVPASVMANAGAGKIILDAVPTPEPPFDFELLQNYPNPFNPVTVIAYSIPVSGHVSLKVYGALGNEVTTLLDEFRNAGRGECIFNAAVLPSGIYCYRFISGKTSAVKQMALVR